MKTATVADLRNNFRRISSWIEHGETVRILKHGKPFARLTGENQSHSNPRKVDFVKQLREIWGDQVFSEKEVATMREAELEGEDG